MRRVCRNCKMVMDGKSCPRCNVNTTPRWSGYIGITDPENSEIAKQMDIKLPGEYALKVR